VETHVTPLGICEWLQSTPLASMIQESAYGFPIVVAAHLLGLTLSVGTLLWVDLRLIGVALRPLRVSEVYRGLAPWFFAGFAMMLVTGATLFTAYATLAYGNIFFRVKIAAIALAGANAVVLHFVTQRTSAQWDDAARPPIGARVAGLVSILLWVTVMLAGRMMSYTMFSAAPTP
jgi:hypothetical protein